MTQTQALLTILFIAFANLLTRALPFWVFHGQPSAFVRYLGVVLPGAVIAMLVVYCFKGVTWLSGSHGVPELLAAAAVAGLHLWKKNTLLSIGVGTALYMLLIRI